MTQECSISSGSTPPLPASSASSPQAESKVCTGCKREVPLDGFSPSPKGKFGRDSRCKQCRRNAYKGDPDAQARNREAARRWKARNPEAVQAHNERLRHDRRARREAVIGRYGGACTCCGESRYEFLAVDHIDGGGNAERRERGTNGLLRVLYQADERLPGYRVLCHNCNAAMGYYGYCPHVPQMI